MKVKNLLFPFLFSFSLGVGISTFVIKRETSEIRVPPQSQEINSKKENSRKNNQEEISQTQPTQAQEKSSIIKTNSTSSVNETVNFDSSTIPSAEADLINSSGRMILPPPTNSLYQPSSEDPQKTIEAFLQAVKEGNADNFQYFLNFEARNNKEIHLIPAGWSANNGTAVISDQMKGDAGTKKITVSFYRGKETEGVTERIGYFLVKSFGKWLIFETVVEK